MGELGQPLQRDGEKIIGGKHLCRKQTEHLFMLSDSPPSVLCDWGRRAELRKVLCNAGHGRQEKMIRTYLSSFVMVDNIAYNQGN